VDNQSSSITNTQFQGISNLPDVVQYISFLNKLLECRNEFTKYQIVKEQEDRKRLDITSQTAKELTLISGKLALMEKELLADKEDLRRFINGTMDAIPKLIELGQFELIDKLHERVANNLQGRVSRVANTFNSYNSDGNIRFLESDDNKV
jgi:hypothetical protein